MQISFFDGTKPYKITKPIRLIELFAGIGAQAKALQRLGVPFEHYRICEFDKYVVQSYNAIHGTAFKPSDITKIHAEDLAVVDTDKYCYVMTYSFPCQDLSVAGNQKGMQKGSGTRSGLLWEVERLLDEMNERPQVLLMENVPQVIAEANAKDFAMWVQKLESLGYKNYWECLNAKDFGVPQNRNRCFMVSILGDYFYTFPKGFPLKERLKDRLEKDVDKKYYLKEDIIRSLEVHKQRHQEQGHGFGWKPTTGGGYTTTIKTESGYIPDSNFIIEPIILDDYNQRIRADQSTIGCITTNCGNEAPRNGWKVIESHPYELSDKMKKHINSYHDKYKVGKGNLVLNRDVSVSKTTREGCSRADTSDYISPDLPSNHNIANIDCLNIRIRKLTPKECWRLMDFDDADIDKAKASGVSDSQLYKQAGNSIVVAVLEAIFKEML